jgi:hypothetical protein
VSCPRSRQSSTRGPCRPMAATPALPT